MNTGLGLQPPQRKMNLNNRIEDRLYDEQFDIEFEILHKLDHLIGASWDSNTLKKEIESLMEQHSKIRNELYEYQEKQKQ